MSYILGALRKADKERKGDSAQQHAEADWDAKVWDAGESTPARTSSLKILLIATACLFLLILWLLWIWVLGRDDESALIGASQVSKEQLESSQTYSENVQDGALSPVAVNESDVSEESKRELDFNGYETRPATSEAPQLPQITGHLYVQANRSLSRIFSDSGSFRIGHVFEDGLVLESISESRATFGWRGQAYHVEFGE